MRQRRTRSTSGARLTRQSGRTARSLTRTLRDVEEMGRAAATTIAARIALMAEAAADPRRLRDPELRLMVTEKMEAAAASAAALTPQLVLPGIHALRWLQESTALLARGTFAGGPLSAGWWREWHRLAEGLALINAAYAAAMLETAAEMASLSLAPIHRAATANARRLGLR